MQEVKAYVRESMLDAVLDDLNGISELPGIAIVELKGVGHRANDDGPYRNIEMVKLEID